MDPINVDGEDRSDIHNASDHFVLVASLMMNLYMCMCGRSYEDAQVDPMDLPEDMNLDEEEEEVVHHAFSAFYHDDDVFMGGALLTG